MPQLINKYKFLILLCVLALTFFTRNNFKDVVDIAPQVLSAPIQKELPHSDEITFSRDGYAYRLKPIFDYEISALVVGKMNYRLFSIYKYDSAFPVDLCLIWGSNAAKGIFRHPTIKFVEDCRWCWAQWMGKIDFNHNEISNNHLLIVDQRIENKALALLRGDQVRIKGKLVDVEAQPVGKGSGTLTWKTSTNRQDSGAGACEVIFVEEIELLKKAHPVVDFLFKASFFTLAGLLIYGLARFFLVRSG